MALSEADIEAVAARVADLLRTGQASAELVDAAEIARRFGVSRDFVYDHADDLGAVRLGKRPQGSPPLRSGEGRSSVEEATREARPAGPPRPDSTQLLPAPGARAMTAVADLVAIRVRVYRVLTISGDPTRANANGSPDHKENGPPHG